jgi:hypothetical protein
MSLTKKTSEAPTREYNLSDTAAAAEAAGVGGGAAAAAAAVAVVGACGSAVWPFVADRHPSSYARGPVFGLDFASHSYACHLSNLRVRAL